MSKPPPEGEMHKTRHWNGKEWHYCCKETGGKCGGVWRVHKPPECKGRGYDPKKARKKQKEVVLQEAIDTLAGGYETPT